MREQKFIVWLGWAHISPCLSVWEILVKELAENIHCHVLLGNEWKITGSMLSNIKVIKFLNVFVTICIS